MNKQVFMMGFYTFQMVQDFFHQWYDGFMLCCDEEIASATFNHES